MRNYFPLASAILRLIKQNDGPNDGSPSLAFSMDARNLMHGTA